MATAPTKSAAFKRLGVEQKLLHSVPNISLMLADILTGLTARDLPDDPYYYLNISPDHAARQVMEVHDSIPPFLRKFLPIEAFCVAAGVDPHAIVDSVVGAITRMNALNSTVQLAVSQPDVVKTNIEAALDKEHGYLDRVLHMKVSGLMPMPKGAKTIVNVQNTANASSAPVQQALVLPAPAPEQTVRRLSERLHAIRGALPPPKIEDAVLVDEE